MKKFYSISLLAVVVLPLFALSCGGGSNGSFSLSNGLDGDGVIDRDTGILPRVTHTFYRVGTIGVTLRITDNLGFSSTQSINLEVIAPQNNLTPTIALDVDVTNGAPPPYCYADSNCRRPRC